MGTGAVGTHKPVPIWDISTCRKRISHLSHCGSPTIKKIFFKKKVKHKQKKRFHEASLNGCFHNPSEIIALGSYFFKALSIHLEIQSYRDRGSILWFFQRLYWTVLGQAADRSFIQVFHTDGKGLNTQAIFHPYHRSVVGAAGWTQSRDMNWHSDGTDLSQTGVLS